MSDRKITPEEYETLQSQLFTIARLVRDMPLTAFLEQLAHADSVGPMLDPTAWRHASKRLDLIKRLAEGLRAFQRSIPTIEEALEADAAAATYPHAKD